MLHRKRKLLAVAAAVALAAAGCSSSKSSSGGGQTYTIGVLTDVTGAAASGNKTAVEGSQAGAVYAKRQGYTFKFVVGDTATTPAGALAAAQKLVEVDHVFAVMANSA